MMMVSRLKLNTLADMGGHALSMLGWGGAGALLFEMNRRNELLLDIKKNQLRQSVLLSSPHSRGRFEDLSHG